MNAPALTARDLAAGLRRRRGELVLADSAPRPTRKHARRARPSKPRGPSRSSIWTDDEVRAFHARYMAERIPIWKMVGRNKQQVLHRAFRRLGLPTRSPADAHRKYWFTDDEVRAFHAEHVAGATLTALQAKHDISRYVLADAFHRLGLPTIHRRPGGPRKTLTAEQKTEARGMLAGGASWRATAARFGMAKETLRNILQDTAP